MAGYIRPSFYEECCTPEGLRRWAEAYTTHGEISVPFLEDGCLAELTGYAQMVEPSGKHRYGKPRPAYPPGEVAAMPSTDPRKELMTDVNMTAVASRHMLHDDVLQWIYHSPQLRGFLAGVMGCEQLHTYLCDLGIAINLMRPAATARTALGFHFDSIDSSTGEGEGKGGGPGTIQPKGATGVIGIQDCDVGGERVVFNGVGRGRVGRVREILDQYDPLQPGRPITGPLGGAPSVPAVCTEPTKGMLYLFNGGNVLHGVSAVHEGSRIAAVFMFRETPPSETDESAASANFFYQS